MRLQKKYYKTLVFSIVLLFFLSRFAPIFQNGLENIQRIIGLRGEEIFISGTGSMYPMFPKGKGDTDIARSREIVSDLNMKRFPGGILLGNRLYFHYSLNRSDVVSFSNEKTAEISQKQYGKESGFVKRVIGLAGDTIEIRDGFITVNGNRQKEAYTARPRSTFGGTFLTDCKKVTIPDGKVFVMGDNRTGSSDSRHELGLINEEDIDHVLPWVDQDSFKNKWRDPSRDDELVTQPTLDAVTYVALLNEKRKDAKLPPLKLQEKLLTSTKKRGEDMLKTGDISFEATKSGYTVDRAFRDVGYSNIVWGEAPTVGFYSAEELIDNSFEFPDTKKFLLNPEFQDIGVSAVLGSLNGCPTQIVIQHFGGYKPPNYPNNIVDNWKQALANLRDVKPSWERIKTIEPFYDQHKTDVDRMIQLLEHRITNIERVVSRMERNEWLTKEEQAYADLDKGLYEEQETLAKRLNSP